MTIISMLKVILREDANVTPETLDVSIAVDVLAYAMQKVELNKIQQLFGFLT
jgi:hypothetical protein